MAAIDVLALLIPKPLFASIDDLHRYFGNKLYPHNEPLNPLASVLSCISNHLGSSSRDQLNALFEAAIDLFPIAVGYYPSDCGRWEDSGVTNSLRRIKTLIEQNLDKPTLSADNVASQLGVSKRWIHKLFQSSGATFATYVTTRRLECIRADLVAANSVPISLIALRWGFNDISTFNRAFKQRFGCSPSTARFQT